MESNLKESDLSCFSQPIITENRSPEPFPSVSIRHKSKESDKLRISLQDCLLKDNEMKLESLLAMSRNKHGQRANSIYGLLCVLNQLTLKNKHGRMAGYLPFQEAYEMSINQ